MLKEPKMKNLHKDLLAFLRLWSFYFYKRLRIAFLRFEKSKDSLVEKLMFGRGKMVRPFIHTGMVGLVILGVLLAPIVASSFPGFAQENWHETPPSSAVLSAVTTESDSATTTLISTKPRSEIVDYQVETGDTLSLIGQKFGISIDTLRWANNLDTISSIKPGQTLKILPVTGMVHKVKKGETVYSIAKYYNTDAQGIVDFPFNNFADDENFTLIAGQDLIVPDGVMPKVTPWSPSSYIVQKTPNAGTVTATGLFVWPTSGTITQRFSWYHKAIDIANSSLPPILAADSGKVIVAGWPDNIGYGNRVMIDHGNGFVTLYCHMSKIMVSVGQTVNRGDQIGIVGSTGRSTGPHLHFEIRRNGVSVDPMAYLK